MARLALAAALILAVGLLPAFAVTRRWLVAAILAPLMTAAIATVAVVGMVAIGGALSVWLIVAIILAAGGTVSLLRRRVAPMEYATTADTLWITIPLIPPTLFVFTPATAWDANSIWWLHAGYFARGSAVARQAMGDPVAVPQPDYPPLPSAPIAAIWKVLGTAELPVAQLVSGMITLAAIALLGLAVRQALGAAPPTLARLAGVLVALAAWANEPLSVMAGYSDALWAASFVAGGLPLLLGRRARALDIGLLAVAALSKNEGLFAVSLLAILLTLRSRSWRQSRVVWLPVAAGATWLMIARAVGATNDLQSGGHFKGLLTLDPQVWHRLSPTLGWLWLSSGPVLAATAVVAIIGAVALRPRRLSLDVGNDLWIWLMAGAYAATIIVIYLISPLQIQFHLKTSMPRVSLPLVLMACASCAIWATVAVSPGPNQGKSAPDAKQPPSPEPIHR